MVKKISLLSIVMFLLIYTSAEAHVVGSFTPVYTEQIQAGPYTLIVGFNEYPIKAQKSLLVTIYASGGISDKTGSYTLVPEGEKPAGNSLHGSLLSYPGVPDAWVLQLEGIPKQGEWTWEFTVNGPDGQGIGNLEHFQVTPPPKIPKWFGWLIGIFPLYGLIWFGLRDNRHARRLQKQSK